VCSLEGKLNRAAFAKCLERLFAAATTGGSGGAAAELTSRMQLNMLYEVFDYNGDGAVSVEELVAGLSFLCTTSTEHKLALAFLVVDQDKNGSISALELHHFFVSLFSVLVAATAQRAALHLPRMHTLISRAAHARTQQFMTAADTDVCSVLWCAALRCAALCCAVLSSPVICRVSVCRVMARSLAPSSWLCTKHSPNSSLG
jgi:hypothetical protein